MGVLSAWLAEIAIITWRDLSNKTDQLTHRINGFPLPADYLATFMVFGVLAAVPKDKPGPARVAVLAAWGYVLATYMNALPTSLNPSGSGGKMGGPAYQALNSAAGIQPQTPVSPPATPGH